MDSIFENILSYANELLAENIYEFELPYTEFRTPPIFILAPPRSGSTLLQQVLISSCRVGYVSNLMARFWNAPAVGATLHREFLPANFTSTFESKFGNTIGVFEPHEWGWFWRKWLRQENGSHHITQPVDWNGLRRTLILIESILGAPLIFDNPLACADLDQVSKGLGASLILNLSRSPWHICNSLLNARLERYGSVEPYYGATTREHERILAVKDPIERIVLQAYENIREMEEQAAMVPTDNRLDIKYEDLRAEPTKIILKFRDFLTRHGAVIESKIFTIKDFPNRNINAKIHKEYKSRLQNSFNKWFL